MPAHTAICDCGHRQEFTFPMAKGATAAAAELSCASCGKLGLEVDWRAAKQGFDMVFRPGFYNIGTNDNPRLPGKWYDSKREMQNDAARKGILLERQ